MCIEEVILKQIEVFEKFVALRKAASNFITLKAEDEENLEKGFNALMHNISLLNKYPFLEK